jgi:hypothetical protein
MDKLITLFPRGAHRAVSGKLTAFKVSGSPTSPEVKEVLDYLKSAGYELTSVQKNYAKQVFLRTDYTYEKEDYDKASFLNFRSAKSVSGKGYDYIRNGRLKITFLPPKFRYCFCYHLATLVNPLVKTKLESSDLKGICFLPVDYLKGLKTHQFEEFEVLHGAESISSLWGLYSSVRLPSPISMHEGAYVHDKDAFQSAGEFDLAISPGFHSKSDEPCRLIASQKFYRFWEANLGDAHWNPIKLKDAQQSL